MNLFVQRSFLLFYFINYRRSFSKKCRLNETVLHVQGLREQKNQSSCTCCLVTEVTTFSKTIYLFTLMSLSSTLAKKLQLKLSILVHTSTKKPFSITVSLRRTRSYEWNGYVSWIVVVFYLQALGCQHLNYSIINDRTVS